MGNTCCSEEMKASINFDDSREELERAFPTIQINKKICYSRLDTVKEEINDCSEQSEFSVGKHSRP